MSDTVEIIVSANKVGIRLDKLLSEALPDVSRSRLTALIKDGHVSSHGKAAKRPSYSVKLGEAFIVTTPPTEDPEPEAENIPLEVIFVV